MGGIYHLGCCVAQQRGTIPYHCDAPEDKYKAVDNARQIYKTWVEKIEEAPSTRLTQERRNVRVGLLIAGGTITREAKRTRVSGSGGARSSLDDASDGEQEEV